MNRYFFVLLLSTAMHPLWSQNMDHLAGNWKDNAGNIFILEKNDHSWRWKNEKSQIWTELKLVSGTSYTDDDGYRYEFNEKRGSLRIVNPDNERDIKTVSMIDFRKPLPSSSVQAPVPTKEPEHPKPERSGGTGREKVHGFLVGYRGSLNAPVGFVIGGIGKSGGLYFGFRTSSLSRSQPLSETSYKSNGIHKITDGESTLSYVYTGYRINTRGAITIGYTVPVNHFLSLCAGLGYGWARQWELYDIYDLNTGELNNADKQTYGVSESSTLGVEFELIGSYHFKMFHASTGISFVNFTNPDLVVGVGFLFN